MIAHLSFIWGNGLLKFGKRYLEKLDRLNFDWNCDAKGNNKSKIYNSNPGGRFKHHLWNSRIVEYMEFTNIFGHGHVSRYYIFNGMCIYLIISSTLDSIYCNEL